MNYKTLEELTGGGSWLGACRSWLQNNIKNGDTMLWSSDKLVQLPFNKFEDLALQVAGEVLETERQSNETHLANIRTICENNANSVDNLCPFRDILYSIEKLEK